MTSHLNSIQCVGGLIYIMRGILVCIPLKLMTSVNCWPEINFYMVIYHSVAVVIIAFVVAK